MGIVSIKAEIKNSLIFTIYPPKNIMYLPHPQVLLVSYNISSRVRLKIFLSYFKATLRPLTLHKVITFRDHYPSIIFTGGTELQPEQQPVGQ